MLSLLFLTLSLQAQELNFATVQRDGLTGLSAESHPQKVRDDAAAYAYYRRYPKATRGMEIWQNCYEKHDAHFFCDMILEEREKPVATGTDKEKRKKFFDAVISLDAPESRAKNCAPARKVLSALTADASAVSVHTRANYWLWVCAKTLNETEEAARLAGLIVANAPLSHHAILVLADQPRLNEYFSDQNPEIQFRSALVPEINPYIAGIEAAMELKEDGAAAVFGSYINSKLAAAEPELRVYMAILMARVSASIPSVLPVGRVLAPLFQARPDLISLPLLRLLFPSDYELAGADPKKRILFRNLIEEHKLDLDPALLSGLIHQESAINPRAASSAGAYGLTQMLIGTANDQWRKMSGNPQAAVTPAMLQDPAFSVKVGAADFQRRLQAFEGNRVLAVASYNAGETGVRNWLKEVKPIRDPQILADVMFMNRMNAETHVPQYVGAVLSKAFWYSRLYPSLDVQR